MSADSSADEPWLSESPRPLLVSRPGSTPRPFMAGILVAWLSAHGIPFSVGYATAREVESRLRSSGSSIIASTDISVLIRAVLGSDPSDRSEQLDRGILVTGKGGRSPFSKGVLSQSLLAAAIDPADAFAVARDIESALVERKAFEIHRTDLRALAYESIEARLGGDASQRYLTWRRTEESGRPVVILLGGTSGVGKTSLALEVARRLGIARVQSTDSIRQVMRLMISKDLMPWIHASSYEAGALVSRESNPRARVLDGFQAQASSVAVGVHASIDRSMEESASLVIDGVSLLPGVIDVDRYRGQAHVVFCVVATRDELALRERFRVRAAGQPQRLAQRYLDHLEGILDIQRHLVQEAERHGFPVVDNIDLDQSAIRVIAHVLDQLTPAAPA